VAFDGNIDFLDYALTSEYVLARLAVFNKMGPSSSQWTRARRAYLHVDEASAALKMEEGYRSFTRYLSFVHYLNDALRLVFAPYPDIVVTLNNFQLLPFAPVDLANNLRKALEGLHPLPLPSTRNGLYSLSSLSSASSASSLSSTSSVSSARQQHGLCSGSVPTFSRVSARQQGNCSPFDDWYADRLFPKVEQHQPDLIAFSLTYLSQVFPTFYAAARLRERFPKMKMIIGGGLLNCYRDRPHTLSLLYPLFDRIILGRAAHLFMKPLMEPLMKPLMKPLGTGGENPCIETGDRLTDLPTPDYGDFDLAGYFSPRPTLPYATSLGCYWNKCAFCPDAGRSPHVSGSKDLALNLRKTLDAYPKALFHFTDPAVSPANMEIIADTFAGRMASYYSFVRFEACFEDSAFMKRLASSGCRMLQFGLESASERLLALSRKGIDLARARRILELSAQEKILNYVYLLFGLPSETEEDRHATLQFIAENHMAIHFINPALMNLPIGSPMERMPDRFLIDRTYDLTEPGAAPDAYDLGDQGDAGTSFSLYKGFISNGEDIRPRARRFLTKVFSTHSLVAPILKNDPPFFRAAHAPFLINHSSTRETF